MTRWLFRVSTSEQTEVVWPLKTKTCPLLVGHCHRENTPLLLPEVGIYFVIRNSVQEDILLLSPKCPSKQFSQALVPSAPLNLLSYNRTIHANASPSCAAKVPNPHNTATATQVPLESIAYLHSLCCSLGASHALCSTMPLTVRIQLTVSL
jgi:hypothetical protein